MGVGSGAGGTWAPDRARHHTPHGRGRRAGRPHSHHGVGKGRLLRIHALPQKQIWLDMFSPLSRLVFSRILIQMAKYEVLISSMKGYLTISDP